MKVKQLMRALSKLNQNAEVVISTNDGDDALVVTGALEGVERQGVVIAGPDVDWKSFRETQDPRHFRKVVALATKQL